MCFRVGGCEGLRERVCYGVTEESSESVSRSKGVRWCEGVHLEGVDAEV